MKGVWPKVPLSEVLSEVSRPERPVPDQEYRFLGMRWYGGGLFEKERRKGRAVKAGYIYRVEEGDLVYNRLFAWKGAFGIVGPDVTGAYVSNEFPCFTVNKDLVSPDFLKWFVCRSTFWEAAETLSTGASRQSRLRLKQERFLSLCMPLPRLPEQRRIAAKIAQIATRVDEARRLIQQIEDEQFALLLRRVEELSQGAPRAPMSEVAPVIRRPVDVQPSEWYPELGVRSFGKGTFHKEAIKGSKLGSKRIYRIEPGDLLFSNVFSWEGAIAVVQPEDKGRFGSHRFITCVPDPDRATPEFLCYYFLSDEGLAEIRAASPGAAGRNKTLGVKKLEEILVPLPPITKQRDFCELVRRLRMANSIHRQTATSLDHFMSALLDQAFRGEL